MVGNKKILIISNACFSSINSNGRTLAKLFNGIDSDRLAQFYVYGYPDQTVCKNFYHVSDHDALFSFLRHNETGNIVGEISEHKRLLSSSHRSNKTPTKMLLRELIWKFGKWYGSNLVHWVNAMNPACIFLFLGDNTFLPRLAQRIAKEYDIPIIGYTTEDYYFKRYNYLTKHWSPLYFLFHHMLKRTYHQCEPYVQRGIFNTPMLTELYRQEFSFPCECVFAKSDIKFIENSAVAEKDQVKVSYLGNLGLNRHKALMEVADCLNEILPGNKLHIYGTIPETIKDMFLANDNIKYEGFVEYNKVVSIIHESSLLVHVEYDSVYNQKDLKYAFSTKIADSVCSGTPLLMYGNNKLAETDFLLNNHCAFVVNTKDQLKQVMMEALFSLEHRKEVVENARVVRKNYFLSGSPLLSCFE